MGPADIDSLHLLHPLCHRHKSIPLCGLVDFVLQLLGSLPPLHLLCLPASSALPPQRLLSLPSALSALLPPSCHACSIPLAYALSSRCLASAGDAMTAHTRHASPFSTPPLPTTRAYVPRSQALYHRSRRRLWRALDSPRLYNASFRRGLRSRCGLPLSVSVRVVGGLRLCRSRNAVTGLRHQHAALRRFAPTIDGGHGGALHLPLRKWRIAAQALARTGGAAKLVLPLSYFLWISFTTALHTGIRLS